LSVSCLLATSAYSQEVIPPKPLETPPAVYPTGHTEAARVVLRVTVNAQGTVDGVELIDSAGADFDRAAEEAVRRWKFAPALRDGQPFAARIRIPFVFQPPLEAAPTSSSTPLPGPPPQAGEETTPTRPPTASPSATPTTTPTTTPTATPTSSPAATSTTTPTSGVIPTEAEGPHSNPSTAPPTVVPIPEAAPEPTLTLPDGGALLEVQVRGAQRKELRAGSDFQIEVGQLSVIAGTSAADILRLAPGIFIANEGGAGHADQVFLRGFDAEQGQAIEFTVNGVPINQVDNPDAQGYADTHFIIPELVKELRVIEGPFDPHQGDFAVAGSAAYELAVPDRRLEFKLEYGSFNSKRALALWAPPTEREGTFAAVQAFQSDGFGVNRSVTNASAMAQYEGELGTRGLWHLLATAYATHYKSAGVVRADDVASGAIDFYGTEDPSQGGDAQRFSFSFDLTNPVGDGVTKLQVFSIYQTVRILEDFTGFLLDQDEPGQSPHPQRGDGIQQQYAALTVGGRSSYKLTKHFWDQDQSLELGFYARYDHTTPVIDRVRFGTQIPYLVDQDLVTDVVDIAGYIDLDLHIGKRLTLRGGLRQEYFSYDIQNNCAAQAFVPTAPLNVPCQSLDLAGPRLPSQTTTASGFVTEPKGTLLYQLDKAFTATASAGIGAQSLDARYITQDELAPFNELWALEAGVLYHQRSAQLDLNGRLVGYYTHVAQELLFDPNQGRLDQSGGTSRGGGVLALRATGPWYDELLSATYAYAVFDTGGSLVPYVPNLIARSDTAVFHPLPWSIADHQLTGKAGLGISYVGQRALPYGQTAAPTLVLDASARVRWDFLELGINGENLLNTQYPLSEFFYASSFNRAAYPTLVPVEHFTAAPPLAVYVTLAFILDQESDR
jgi:iron complex outermembrane recepter protein